MKKSYVKLTQWKDKNRHTVFSLEVHHYNRKDKMGSGIHTSLSKSMAKTLVKNLLQYLKEV